ncbi:MAG TPA: HAMP domain-containing protein [Candidatus Acidoferrum sp.]|nr:HAMP domain-containing protein [Candidatus Acidoferrum sp.]
MNLKPTIKNKLAGGFTGLLLLMGIVAAIGIAAVIGLRRSALETARVGDRLNAMALEIQVHNLEAQRLAKSYLSEVKKIGAVQAREQYLDEAGFEVHEIEALAAKAVQIAPTDEKRTKFQLVANATKEYALALENATKAVETDAASASVATYDESAQRLREAAEDGEMAGRDASQTSQTKIEEISKRAVPIVIGVSLIGLVLAVWASITLARAILIPVEHLREVAENVSLGNLNMTVKRYSEDEIGDLADSFSRMVTAVKFFRMEAETAQGDIAGHAEVRP